MTFSIAAFDPDTGDLGVAVESKFPNVRAVVPFAKVGVGAVATQCFSNTAYASRGFALLESGASPEEAIAIMTRDDPRRAERQVGIVDVQGRSAHFTGDGCFGYAGGIAGENFTVQGNVLTGVGVLEAMAESFQASTGPLAERLIGVLETGQAAGGEKRGQQSTALLVVRKNGGYGDNNDRYVDLSVCDHTTPIAELRRLYNLYGLTFFKSDPDRLVDVDEALGRELQQILSERGFYDGPVDGRYGPASQRAMRAFMGWENYDERIRDDALVDLDVVADIRSKHADWRRQQD